MTRPIVLRWKAACTIAILVIGGIANAFSPQVVPIEYKDVSPNRLVSVFKTAYLRSRFEVGSQKTRAIDERTKTLTRLLFTFSNPEHPQKKKGIVSFNIIYSRQAAKCSPCLVYPEILGFDMDGYDEKEAADLVSMLETADREAQDKIAAELGKRVR